MRWCAAALVPCFPSPLLAVRLYFARECGTLSAHCAVSVPPAVLITSRSSLSACAAYLKRADGLVIYHPFWHEMLSPEDGHVACNDPQLEARVGAYVRAFASRERQAM